MSNSYYFSATPAAGLDRPYSAPGVGAASSGPVGSLNSGTASYTSDVFELRVTTGITAYPNPTKRDILNFLNMALRFVMDQEGSSTISGQGLDALIKANTGPVGIP